MRKLVSLAAGGIFGGGLVIADMINAARVQAFLDPFGAWDPTLAFVMGGAMLPMLIAWAFSKRRKPVFAEAFPGKPGDIDARLIAGSALFGAGWGLGGFCPGPALASLSYGGWQVALFCAAMVVGMGLHNVALAPKAAKA